MFPHVNVMYEEDKETGKIQPTDFRVKKEFSAYLLWCVMTGIATHAVKSVMVRQRMNALIARQFVR